MTDDPPTFPTIQDAVDHTLATGEDAAVEPPAPETPAPEPLTPERVQAIQERLRRETAEMAKPRHRRRL